MGDFLITLGRTRAVFLAQLPWFVGLVAALIIGVRTHGIAGAGAAQAIISIGLIIPIYLFFLRRCGVSVALVARALWSPLFWSLAAAVVAYLVARTIPNTLLACAAGGAAGLLVYTVPNLSYLREGIRAARAGCSGGAPDPIGSGIDRRGRRRRRGRPRMSPDPEPPSPSPSSARRALDRVKGPSRQLVEIVNRDGLRVTMGTVLERSAARSCPGADQSSCSSVATMSWPSRERSRRGATPGHPTRSR